MAVKIKTYDDFLNKFLFKNLALTRYPEEWQHYFGSVAEVTVPVGSVADSLYLDMLGLDASSRKSLSSFIEGRGTRMRVSINVAKAIRTWVLDKAYITQAGPWTFVDYNSEDTGKEYYCAYNFHTKQLAAGDLTSCDEDDPSIRTLSFGSPMFSGTPMFLAILAGEYMGRIDGSTFRKCVQFLHNEALASSASATKAHVEGLVVNDTVAQFAGVIQSVLYGALNTKSSVAKDIGLTMRTNFTEYEHDSDENIIVPSFDVMDLKSIAKKYGMRHLDGEIFDSQCEHNSLFDDVVGSEVYVGSSSSADKAGDADKPLTTEERMVAIREECKLDIHKLSPAEKAMVPHVDNHYKIMDSLLELARETKFNWKCPDLGLAMNFLFEGDSGSGKTTATYFLADAFGIPRTKITMDPFLESSKLIGAFLPDISNTSFWELDEEDKKAVEQLKPTLIDEMGARTSEPSTEEILNAMRHAMEADETRYAVKAAYGIPDDDEIDLTPDWAWEVLGGEGEAPDTDTIRAQANKKFEGKFFRLLNILTNQVKDGAVKYKFIYSELIRAFKYGWLLEIQEAASVLRPGVLTELNSLLEPNGSIELPNGEIIRRHPDTIVVFTTNRDYNGNVDLNESLRDRCFTALKFDTPSANELAARAMAVLKFDDEAFALGAAETIVAVAEEAENKNIAGACGSRSLIGWLRGCMYMKQRRAAAKQKLTKKDIKDQFMKNVVYKMTTRDDDVAILETAFEANSKFCSKLASGEVKRY